MKLALLIAMSITLTGCGFLTPKPDQIVYVNKVVREPCVDPAKVPVRPKYLYGKGVKPDERAAGLILIKDFEAAEQYGYDWEAATTGCIMFVP